MRDKAVRDRMLAAIKKSEEFRTQLEDKIANDVALARGAGASWAAIAKVLGVSRQATWERYGKEEGR